MNLKIFTKNIEEHAINQINELLKQETFKNSKVRIMPDVHAGKGCVIGFTGNLGEKFGINSKTASSVAGNLIPQILGSLVNKAKDPNDNSFQISDIIAMISADNTQNLGIIDAISKYGGQFGLDQNADDKVDINDAMSAVSGKGGGLADVLGKLFGK